MERIQDYLRSMNNFARIIDESGREIFVLRANFLYGDSYLVALPKKARKESGPYYRVEFAEGDYEDLAEILTKDEKELIEERKDELIKDFNSGEHLYILHKFGGLRKNELVNSNFLERLINGYSCKIHGEEKEFVTSGF